MINLATGEISFQDGLLFSPHCRAPYTPPDMRSDFPVRGWRRFNYGERISEYGMMEVGAVGNEDHSIHLVIIAHQHSFYDQPSPEDAERNVFHEFIVTKDLLGQREFSWGVIHVSTDPKHNKNWLVVIYTPGANVPDRNTAALRELFERAKIS